MLSPRSSLLLVIASILLLGPGSLLRAQETRPVTAAELDVLAVFRDLLATDQERASVALDRIEARWQVAFAPMLVDALRVLAGSRRSFSVIRVLERKTGQSLGRDVGGWWDWIWKQQIEPHPRYAEVKAVVYSGIDPRFVQFFGRDRPLAIRLDEVRWGGVIRDGIPPLRRPRMIRAPEAGYLADGDVVFGIEINGDLRAYPKRILAWHEMFTDEVGGLEVTGVY